MPVLFERMERRVAGARVDRTYKNCRSSNYIVLNRGGRCCTGQAERCVRRREQSQQVAGAGIIPENQGCKAAAGLGGRTPSITKIRRSTGTILQQHLSPSGVLGYWQTTAFCSCTHNNSSSGYSKVLSGVRNRFLM